MVNVGSPNVVSPMYDLSWISHIESTLRTRDGTTRVETQGRREEFGLEI